MKLKVLVVEDVEEMRELLSQALGQMRFVEVSGTAGNLWEARLEVSRHRPGLVLLDEVLPGESIAEFILEMKAESIPVLLITGMEKPDHSIPEGVKGRVAKPSWKGLARDLPTLEAAILKAVKA